MKCVCVFAYVHVCVCVFCDTKFILSIQTERAKKTVASEIRRHRMDIWSKFILSATHPANFRHINRLLVLQEKYKLTLLLLNMTCPVLANSVDSDQLASEEANWSGSALFVIKYVNFYQKPDQVIWLAGN